MFMFKVNAVRKLSISDGPCPSSEGVGKPAIYTDSLLLQSVFLHKNAVLNKHG